MPAFTIDGPAAAGGNGAWYYALNGEKVGPIDRPELMTLLDSGEIDGKTYVFGPGFEEWKLAEEALDPRPTSAVINRSARCLEPFVCERKSLFRFLMR